MLEKEAKRRGFELKTLFKPEWLKEIYKKFTLQTPEDMYAAVGYGGIATGQILHKLIEAYRKEHKPVEEIQTGQIKERKTGEASGIIAMGLMIWSYGLPNAATLCRAIRLSVM